MKPVPVPPILGMNNRLPDERLATKDGVFLRNAVNVDITSGGTVKRRQATAISLGGTDCHSFWSFGSDAYMVDGAQLYHLRKGPSGVEKAAIADVTPSLQMSYTHDGVAIRASNGVQSFRVDGSSVSPWAPPVPSWSPVFSTLTGGALPAGVMQFCVSYIASDGSEGPTTIPVSCEVPETGVVSVSNIPHLNGYTTALYATQPNDDNLFLVGLPAGTTFSIATKPVEGPKPIGLLKAVLPPGHIVRAHNGRMYSATGNTLFYSEPHAPGLFDPISGYIAFPEAITLVEPCVGGVFVSADKTYWLQGDPSAAPLRVVSDTKAVLGTSSRIPDTTNVWWMSDMGMVVGTPSGEIELVQDDNVAVESAIVGASLFREQDGMKQMITSLFSPQSTVATARSYMDAEIVRKETQP